MTTPTAPGTFVGETATATDYSWVWNGYGWDLVDDAATGQTFGTITYAWTVVANPQLPVALDYV